VGPTETFDMFLACPQGLRGAYVSEIESRFAWVRAARWRFTHTTQNADWVKNLFFGTGRSVLRKGAEFAPVPVAEFLLGKRRILEIYLNVVEWGPTIPHGTNLIRPPENPTS
jgi:hypothetical protein